MTLAKLPKSSKYFQGFWPQTKDLGNVARRISTIFRRTSFPNFQLGCQKRCLFVAESLRKFRYQLMNGQMALID